ncbi:hypothetical protein L210DRAFT_3755280 [Boletus edulis BED1]|uniref:Uncharacterized protein n=1 Tax=Boletus edulis BED1 TaxID=1328754 RepID=A0AAD4GLP2_BOLED|nr:hypothetical protein L210DRAFT_3755280 [Boletus edulis BED1]
MAPNLTSGTFRVVSLIDDSNPPVGINFIRPTVQSVYLNARVTTWAVGQEGDNTYRLSVGGYPYTGVAVNSVIASLHPEQDMEWIATYRERQDAYTISPIKNAIVGWTVANDDPNSKITLRPIISGRSLPPHFVPTQLFRFEAVDE